MIIKKLAITMHWTNRLPIGRPSPVLDRYVGFNNNQMSKIPKNHGKSWTSEDLKKLKVLVIGNTPTGLIAHKLGRTEDSIKGKASEQYLLNQLINLLTIGKRRSNFENFFFNSSGQTNPKSAK